MTEWIDSVLKKNDIYERRGGLLTGAGLIAAGLLTNNPAFVYAGGAVIVSTLLTPVPDELLPQLAETGVAVTGTAEPHRVIYGTVRTGGVIVFVGTSGEFRERLNLAVALAGHEVNAITELYFDGQRVWDSTNGVADKYSGKLAVETHLGTSGQTVSTTLQNESYPAWAIDGNQNGLVWHGWTGQAVQTSTGSTHDVKNDWSLYCFLVRPTRQVNMTIASWNGGGASGWELEMLATGQVRFNLKGNAVLTSPNNQNGRLDQGVHNRIVVSKNGANWTLYIARDNAFFKSVATATSIYGGSLDTGRVRFGSKSGSDKTFHGKIGRTRIWNVAFNPIQSDGSALSEGDLPDDPRSDWRFSEEAGTSVEDFGAQNNHGTIIGAWTSAYRLRGRAYAVVQLLWDDALYPSGIPEMAFTVQGRKVRDPRTSPAADAFSNNAALCLADYLTHGAFGMGYAESEIDETALTAAANVCDQTVSSQARYTADGVIVASSEHQSVVVDLLSAMAGSLAFVGGRIKIYAGAYVAPTVTLTVDDLRGEFTVDKLYSLSDSFNAVRGVYVGPKTAWQPGNFAPVTNSTYETEDGERVWTEIALPFTTDHRRAQRLAKIHLERNRQTLRVGWPGRLSCLRLEPGQPVAVTLDVMGWSGKAFVVEQVQLVNAGSAAAPVLGCDLGLREVASTMFDWSSGEETTVDDAPDTNLPNPLSVTGPEAVTLASGTGVLAVRLDGTVFSRIKVTWAPSEDQFVLNGGRFDLQYKPSASGGSPTVNTDWTPAAPAAGSATEAYILDVEDGTDYDVRIRAVNAAGVPSAWVTIENHTVIGKTAAPADVTGWSVQQNGDAVVMKWNQVADLDLSGYDIRFGVEGVSWADATPLTQITKGTNVTSAAVPPGNLIGGVRQPWDFLIKAVDTSGNESATAARYQITVQAAFDAIYAVNQAPAWPGTLTHFVRNPATGHLNPQSQSLASDLGFEVFDEYVPTPYSSSSYEAAEIDIDFDDESRVWGSTDLFLGPGEAGAVVPSLELDYRLAAGAYDGFESWGVGEVTARYYKLKVTLDNTSVVGGLKDFIPTVDLLEHSETVAVSVPVGGDVISFAKAYRLAPQVVFSGVTDGGSPAAAAFPAYLNVTVQGFKLYVIDSNGTDIGGNATYTATGV